MNRALVQMFYTQQKLNLKKVKTPFFQEKMSYFVSDKKINCIKFQFETIWWPEFFS